MSAAPKHATRRNPKRRSYGRAIGRIAETLGKPLMPWQQLVADVATEVEDDGRLAYEVVLVTVPRQSGKTTLVGPVQLHRVMTTPGVRCFYTAQSGKDARKRFEDLVTLMKSSPLNAIAQYRWSAGDESITFPNGSALKLFAPTLDAIHGETPPLVTFDEIWKYDELLGDGMLEGAVFPAQLTLAGRRQVWMISTAGTATSTFMRKWVERGREAVKSKGAKWPKLAYFEWGLPDGADPYDPEVVASFHPAVPYTVTADELLEQYTSGSVDRATWLRAFCNMWIEAADPLFPAHEWAALKEKPKAVPSRRDLAITYAIAEGSSDGAVMATWRDTDGRPCTRVVHAAPGSTWMHDFILRLRDEWQPAIIGADDGGPTRRLNDRLRRTLGDADAITTMAPRDFSTACESLLEAARTKELKHDGSLTLSNGIAHLVLKRVGDLTPFSRKDSTGSIAGVEAAAVGLWLYDHHEGHEELAIY